jgi:hypothetical protein
MGAASDQATEITKSQPPDSNDSNVTWPLTYLLSTDKALAGYGSGHNFFPST